MKFPKRGFRVLCAHENCAIDFTHATRPEKGEDLEVAEFCSRGESCAEQGRGVQGVCARLFVSRNQGLDFVAERRVGASLLQKSGTLSGIQLQGGIQNGFDALPVFRCHV